MKRKVIVIGLWLTAKLYYGEHYSPVELEVFFLKKMYIFYSVGSRSVYIHSIYVPISSNGCYLSLVV